MTRFDYDILQGLVVKGIVVEGLRPFARRISMPVGVIRSVQDGREVSVSNLISLCEKLDMEFYLGPPREPETVEVKSTVFDGEEYTAIPRFEAQLAAGTGTFNSDDAPVEHLAFSRDWLSRLGVDATKACLLEVKGASMEPTLFCGDLVLINRNRRTIRNGRIYAFNDIDGTSRVKRLDVITGAAITIRGDANPLLVEQRLGEEMNVVSGGIIGEVVWAAHTLTDGN